MAEEEKLKVGKGVAFVKSRLNRLPRSNDTWEADFQALPKPIMQNTTHYLGMVVTQEGDSLRSDLEVHGRPSVNDLATLLAHAMQRPAGRESPPAQARPSARAPPVAGAVSGPAPKISGVRGTTSAHGPRTSTSGGLPRFDPLRRAPSRRLVLGGQVHLVTEPLQALDQIAPQTVRIQSIKVVHSQVMIIDVMLPQVIENHQDAVAHRQQRPLLTAPRASRRYWAPR